jgi:cytochrome P450
MKVPPRPEPIQRRRLGFWGFARVSRSWLNALTAHSYEMFLGHFRLPGMRVLVINDPVWVERMLIAEPERYPKHRLMTETLAPLIGGSPFATNGAQWQRQRHLLDQAFGHARLTRVFPLMQAACADMRARLQALGPDAVIDVDTVMTHVTDIVWRAIFSRPLRADQAQALFDAFTRYQVLSQRANFLKLLRLPTLGLEGRRQRVAERIRAELAAAVRERFAGRTREQEADASDLLGGLRCASDEAGVALTETEVLDQVGMLFLAGHETSASALGWALYLLADHPPLQQALAAEVAQAAPDDVLQPAALRQLPRVHALFREVLRLYPPVGYFPREATHEHKIRGVAVKPGDALLVMPWLLHRHRRWWAEPDAFDPDRFAPGRESGHPRGAYLPFGLGARACIGAGFAQQEAALILAELLRHFTLDTLPGEVPVVVGRLTVRSDKGIRLRLRPRAGTIVA